MIIVMQQTASQEEIKQVVTRIEKVGLKAHLSYGENQLIIGVIGDVSRLIDTPIKTYDAVLDVVHVSSSYKLVSRSFHPADSVVQVGAVKIGGNQPFVTMAGPCSVEGREQMMTCARMAKAGGATILRGGAFKPRTSPYAFQGLAEEGLIYMREAADAYGLKVITEVMDEANLELVAKYADILQIGARNMQNYKLLQAVGKLNQPVALKRGIAATIDEWLNAAEYIAHEGNLKIILVERGIRTYETATRNTFDLSAVPLIQKMSHLPIIVDPSHGVGVWDLVTPMARAGVAAGANGMIVEIHPEPSKAWSDGQQSLNEEHFMQMMEEVHLLNEAMIKINQLS